jgi:hypothetical protein
MKTEDATISTTLQLVAAADGANLANDQIIAPMAYPLRFGFPTKTEGVC